jgi:hypothetical protein
MNLYQINTTAHHEEDLLIFTDASIEEIRKVLEPMVEEERENDVWHEHSDYLKALKDALPYKLILYIDEPLMIIL